MNLRRLRASGLSILAAAVLVLLPALAWLQYSWLDQIADADRDRREHTLHMAATQLAQDFDGELAKAADALQIESSIVEQQAWSRYAARYRAWTETAPVPQIVRAIYFAEHVEPHTSPAGARTEPDEPRPILRVWNPQTGTFDVTPWPPELQNMRFRFAAFERRIDGPNAARRGRGRGEALGRIERMMLPPSPVGSEQSIVMPVVRATAVEAAETPGTPPPPPPPDVRLLGFTIIQLDLNVLAHDVLPALVRKHLFNADGHSDYSVAVVARDDPSRVIFESSEGAAAATAAQPDASVTMLSARPLFMLARGAGRRVEDRMVVFEASRVPRAAPVRGEPLVVAALEGHWRLVAKHREGSLEAAVARARTRNFLLSSGILALLAAAIGLIIVSARRADRLAQQQLEFVAAVSHELRTPVSVIGAAAGNLADGVVEEPARVKKYGETIQAEARRLGETVERVLQLAGIAAGRGSTARGPVSIADLVDSAMNACRGEIERSGATLEVAVAEAFRNGPGDDAGVPYVVADRGALSSALQNLINNAVKYGGDRPWIRIEAVPAGRSAVRISVEDHGLGISAEDRKHIFDPFYRGREAVARQIQGSGLGLHLVRRIVEAHEGTVGVQSDPQRGSTFTIELPTVHQGVQTLPAQESPAAART